MKKLHRIPRTTAGVHERAERRATGTCSACKDVGNVVLALPQPLYAKGTTTRINCPECGGTHSKEDR